MNPNSDDPEAGLLEVNACLERYQVQRYRGADGRHRVWGDINRIQDIVDGPCRQLFPDGAAEHLHEFFSTEVDGKVADCLRAHGVDLAPPAGPGIEIVGTPPAETVEACFREAYAHFSSPPNPSEAPL